MKTAAPFLLLSVGIVVLAQDLASLPACAQTAALNGAAGSGCGLSDAECFCKNAGFIDSLRGAILTGCTNAADQQAACDWGNAACSTYGVTIPCGSTAVDTTTQASNTGEAETTTSAMAPSSTGFVPSTDAPTTTSIETNMNVAAEMGVTTGSAMTTMTTAVMYSSTSLMNGTHAPGNMTHATTNRPSSTSTGPTSLYTGAGNTAVRQSGVLGTVFGVALLFAFF